MRIRISSDGRVFEGTELQIVQQMHSVAFGREGMTTSEYIDWAVAQLARMSDVTLGVDGATDEERARSFVKEMLRAGLAQ